MRPVNLKDLYEKNDFVAEDALRDISDEMIVEHLSRCYSALNPHYSPFRVVAEGWGKAVFNPMDELGQVLRQLELGAFAGHLAFKRDVPFVEVSSGVGIPSIAANSKYGVESYVVEPNLNLVECMKNFTKRFGEKTGISRKFKQFDSLDDLKEYEAGGLFRQRKLKRPMVVADGSYADLGELTDYVKSRDAAFIYYPCSDCQRHGEEGNQVEKVAEVAKTLDDNSFNWFVITDPVGYARVWKK